MATFTLPKALWRIPEAWHRSPAMWQWGHMRFCTWEQICNIAASLRAEGVEAEAYDGEQYFLVGDIQRGLPRGWYCSSTYSTADGLTTWSEHCALLTADFAVLREAFCTEPMPADVTSAAERAFLMRCLANA